MRGTESAKTVCKLFAKDREMSTFRCFVVCGLDKKGSLFGRGRRWSCDGNCFLKYMSSG